MDYLWLRILITVTVVIALTFYAYEECARRVYEIIISTVAIVVTSPIFGVLAVVSKMKTGKVFDRADGLRFAYPDNSLKKLPFFLLVFVGKENILPIKLGKREQ